MSILLFAQKKQQHKKISMVTCYDYTSACLLAKTNVDSILVGDSLAMTMHGFSTTVQATLDMMILHTAAVARGAPNKLIIGDLPFLSYRKSLAENMDAVHKLMQAGAHAIKLEGVKGNLDFIRHVVDSGVPVMGHLGLTPQSFYCLGGNRIQAKTEAAAEALLGDALLLEKAGCFSLVLECIPALVAKNITQKLSISTIGIGAGVDTDGQVLVWQDLLGFNPNFKAKFVKKYLAGFELMEKAINEYVFEVENKAFPSSEHSY